MKNDTGDGMVTKFANGVQMILQRDGWHDSCGMKFEGTDGWITIADGYEKPEVSSPSLLADADKLVAEYMERTKRPMNHVRNFFDCVKSRQHTAALRNTPGRILPGSRRPARAGGCERTGSGLTQGGERRGVSFLAAGTWRPGKRSASA